MDLSSLLIFLNIAIVATTVAFVVYAFPFRRLPPVRWLLLLMLAFCEISYCILNVYISQSFETMVLFSRLRFLAMGLLTPLWLMFMSTTYGTWKWVQKPAVATVLFLPGCISAICVLFPPLQDLMTTDFAPYSGFGLSVVSFRGGTWFPFHVVWAYCTVVLSLTMGAWTFFKEKPPMRAQILILCCGNLISTITDFYCVATNSGLRWVMLSGSIFIVNELAIVYTAFRHGLLDLVPFAMEKMFRRIPDPVLVVDSKGLLRTFNKAARQLFKISPMDVGKSLSAILPQVRLLEGDFVFKDESNHERFFNLKLENFTSDQTGPQGAIVFFREITMQKEIENRLNKDLEFKARLMSLIAHDLSGNIRNQALLSSVLQKKISEDLRGTVDLLTDSTYASADLMKNILAWAKSQENKFVPVTRPFEIHALLRECLESSEISARLKSIQLIFIPHENPIVVPGDSEMIASVVRNLLTNAIRASSAGKKVSISVRNEANAVRVVIEDEGEGMTPTQVQSLMSTSNHFFTERGSKEGFGIGLTIARRFVELHRGHLEIHSQPGDGTRVFFTLPLGGSV